MPAKKGAFTNQTVQTMKLGKNGSPDGFKVDPEQKGLTLFSRYNGSMRGYLYRYMINGKARVHTIGSVFEHDPNYIGLAEARAEVAGAIAKVKRGIDPWPGEAKPRERATDRLAREAKEARDGIPGSLLHDTKDYYDHKVGNWDVHHARVWWDSMVNHVFPTLGQVPTKDLTSKQIKDTILPFYRTNAPTALVVLGRIKQVIERVIDTDPDRGIPANVAVRVRKLLPEGVRLPEQNHPRLNWKHMPEFYASVVPLHDPWAYALRFMLLTATPRQGEVLGARWTEIDWEQKLWKVPGEGVVVRDGKAVRSPARYKSGKKLHKTTPRLVPLSDEAIDFLKTLPTYGQDGLLFPSSVGTPLRGTLIQSYLNRRGIVDEECGRIIHTHGFRRTFKQWVRAHHPGMIDAADICIDHVVGNKVQRAYDDQVDLENRRVLTDLWCAFVVSAVNVLPMAAE